MNIFRREGTLIMAGVKTTLTHLNDYVASGQFREPGRASADVSRTYTYKQGTRKTDVVEKVDIFSGRKIDCSPGTGCDNSQAQLA